MCFIYFAVPIKSDIRLSSVDGGRCTLRMTCSQNDHLPFDVLGLIFCHYAQVETIRRPLETLLLVCHTWSRSALSHRTLWSNFRIYLGHDDTSTMWQTRLPLRLARCGPDCPLDIDLRNILDCPGGDDTPEETVEDEFYIPWTCDPTTEPTRECYCFDMARKCAESSLNTLAGPKGELCIRWRSLIIKLGHNDWRKGSRLLEDALRHPTPNLISLHLEHVWLDLDSSNIELLPVTIRVARLTLLDCGLSALSAVDGVREARVGWRYGTMHHKAILALSNAAFIQKLQLCAMFYAAIALPALLPELRTLHVESTILPAELYTCDMPHLENISVPWTSRNPIEALFDCQGIRFDKLKVITLQINPGYTIIMSHADYIEVKSSVLELLQRTENLVHLSSSGTILAIFIKVIWEIVECGKVRGFFPSPRASPRSSCLTDLVSGDSFEFTGDETTECLEALARQWQLVPPNVPPREFFDFIEATNPFPLYSV